MAQKTRLKASSTAATAMPESASGDSSLSTSPLEWSGLALKRWLRGRRDVAAFAELLVDKHKIDGRSFLMLTQADLVDLLGLRAAGDIKTLLFHVNQLRFDSGLISPRASPPFSSASPSAAAASSGTESPQRTSCARRDRDRLAYCLLDRLPTPAASTGASLPAPNQITAAPPLSCPSVARRRRHRAAFPEPQRRDSASSSGSSMSTDVAASTDDDADGDGDGDADDGHATNGHRDTKESLTDGASITTGSSPQSVAGTRLAGASAGRSKYAQDLEPERWKTLVAFLYILLVSWLTAFVMVIVHDRVPDMEKYPPLPDILLDNLPHIPWAFDMCEITGMILLSIWILVCLFHRHRFVLMRRFFSISGTIFTIRCITMLITSLSVPGKHLDCSPRPYGSAYNKLHSAYLIWSGAGLSLQGVRTCGDYMFSGHTVSLTLLNFFITEYTSRRIYFLHTFTWICNVFGVFFILAAHEHYSIDVFIAFYISSRLFMYYHALSNNRTFRNSGWTDRSAANRTWFWFPLFTFFESRVDGRVPNEFAYPLTAADVADVVRRCHDVVLVLRAAVRSKWLSLVGSRKAKIRDEGEASSKSATTAPVGAPPMAALSNGLVKKKQFAKKKKV